MSATSGQRGIVTAAGVACSFADKFVFIIHHHGYFPRQVKSSFLFFHPSHLFYKALILLNPAASSLPPTVIPPTASPPCRDARPQGFVLHHRQRFLTRTLAALFPPMKNMKQILAALVAFAAFALTSNAAVVYSDSGQAGPGYAYLTDAWGSFGVSYDSADWYAEYDDAGTAYYGYVLYTADGVYYVDAAYGYSSPSWSFISLTTDSLDFLAPSFLSDFWSAFP